MTAPRRIVAIRAYCPNSDRFLETVPDVDGGFSHLYLCPGDSRLPATVGIYQQHSDGRAEVLAIIPTTWPMSLKWGA